MTPSLLDAVKALDERKTVVYGDTAVLNKQESRFMLSGTDLDVDEVTAMAAVVCSVMLESAARQDIMLTEVVRGTWVDGVLTGLMYARLREKERKT